MTNIVGVVRDVHLSGAEGTLTIWSGFRPTTISVIAPRRRQWTVEEGRIPAGVVAAPGPAIVQLDFGVGAFKSWPVDIPDQDEVSIQELLFQSLPWGPDLPLPPDEEVTDLLRLMADTATTYQAALWEDTNLALTEIYESMTAAQQYVIAGRGYSTDAERYVAQALQHALDALGHSRNAEDLAESAGGSAEETEGLRDEAALLAAQIQALNDQIADRAAEVSDGVVDSEAAREAAEAAAALAADLAEQARAVREQIDRHMADAQAAVAEGERQVQWALERAEEARESAAEALVYAGDAARIVEDVGDVLADAESARDSAEGALSTIQGIGTDVDQIQTQVLTLHSEVLSRHGEVLTAHGEAILAASSAAESASDAALDATETATHAANAADEALSATTANSKAQETFQAQQEAFNEDYSERTLLQSMMLEAVREAQRAAQFEQWRIVTATGRNGSGSDDNVAIASGTGAINVTATGTWVGRMIVHAGWESNSGGGTRERVGDYAIPQPDGSRTIYMDRDANQTNFNRVWGRVDYSIDPAVQRVATTEVGRFVTTGGVRQIPDHTFTAGADGRDYAVTFTVRWPYANFLERFVARIYLNGTMVGEYSKVNVGPVFGQGARTRSVTVTGLEMESGDVLTFHAGTSGGGDQEITDPSSTRVTWIEGG